MRTLGFLLILGSAVICGFSARKSAKDRIAFLRLSVSLVRHAKRKIDLFGTPTGQLFLDFECRPDAKLKVLLQEGLQGDATETHSAHYGAEETQLRIFLTELGRAYKEDALRLCDHYSALFEDRLSEAQAEYTRRKKLYFALPILIAVSIFVLLM